MNIQHRTPNAETQNLNGKPQRREVAEELRELIRMMHRSYREIDGVVRDEGALRTISALKVALKEFQGKKFETTCV